MSIKNDMHGADWLAPMPERTDESQPAVPLTRKTEEAEGKEKELLKGTIKKRYLRSGSTGC